MATVSLYRVQQNPNSSIAPISAWRGAGCTSAATLSRAKAICRCGSTKSAC